MPSTLVVNDTIQRVGYTVIDGVKIVQYTCVIPLSDPNDMRIGSTKLDQDLYKANREFCRADYAAFEDSAFELQEKLLAEANAG